MMTENQKKFWKGFLGTDYHMDAKAKTRYADAETTVEDCQGFYHYGYYCTAEACPYIVKDIHGNYACYGKMHDECKF